MIQSAHTATLSHFEEIDRCVCDAVAFGPGLVGEVEHFVRQHRPKDSPNLVFRWKYHVQHVEASLKSFADDLQDERK